jgi:molybdenum-dependent DNA-binding transcriptional regulator ModE
MYVKAMMQRRGAGAAKPRIRILLGSAIAMGPGKADLLVAIERTGSISAAARGFWWMH